MKTPDKETLKRDEEEFATINSVTTAGKPMDSEFAVKKDIDKINYVPPGRDQVTNKK